MIRVVVFLGVFCSLVSCQYFEEEPQKDVVARVNKAYLYKADIENLVSEGTSPEDSTLIVNNFINQWATRMLLIDRAKVNLDPEDMKRYEKLIDEYRSDLLTDAYINVVISRHLDSTVTESEFREYYDRNKENFRLNDVLLKMRYIHLSPNFEGTASVKEKLFRFNDKDREYLNDHSYEFLSSNLNDSVWVKKDNLISALPVLKDLTSGWRKAMTAELKDSLGIYFLKVEDVKDLNDIAPLPFIQPTLKQIILNKRKLELINKFEADLTKDAIKNNAFEIYTYE
ncbi:MAG TPA: peptidyl-prolyl cis-trans isomerase [Flavobacteriaceae bacterium]|nr:peptidyl-prolyl cis-trans isomerase [Flavobacteriaceae bacterium]